MPSFLQEFDVANARVGAERNPKNTEVICYVNDLDAAPPEWRIRDVRSLAKVTTVTDGCITLGVSVGPRQHIADQLLAKAESFEQCTKTISNARTPYGKVWEFVASTTSCECTATAGETGC